MLQALVEKVADLWNAPDHWIEAERKSASPGSEVEAAPNAAFRSQFLELARDRQRQHGKVVTGLLTIVWQGSRLAALGPRYRDLKVLTEMVTDVVLDQMAGKPDFFLPYDTDNVVLCFASGNRAVTELRAAMMAHALRAALVQRMPDLGGKLRIDAVVTEIEPVEAVVRGPDLAVGLVEMLCRARDSSVLGRISLGGMVPG
jgi:hypothetical protein